MPKETRLTAAAARVAGIPFRLWGQRPYTPPQKALILLPCCISQVMLATPLLAVLHKAYPQAQFDWAVSDWARPAIAGNPHLTEIVRSGATAVADGSWSEIHALIAQIREHGYDTCFIPSRSSLLAYIAWRAGIPQRVGIQLDGRGFAHTFPVTPPGGERHAAAVYLSLAKAVGVMVGPVSRLPMEFYPADTARTTVTRRLIDELNWLGERPLVVLHPGGGTELDSVEAGKQWPAERFVLLGNYLARKHEAQILLVGSADDVPKCETIAGLMAVTPANWAGSVSLGELGALCEMADLYVGGDTGPTHVAAAVGCPTLAIFGPTDPTLSAPYGEEGRVVVLWHEGVERPFRWEAGVTVNEAAKAVEKLLALKNKKGSEFGKSV
jgi:lipopolysaccharide heptosyltransferase II